MPRRALYAGSAGGAGGGFGAIAWPQRRGFRGPCGWAARAGGVRRRCRV